MDINEMHFKTALDISIKIYFFLDYNHRSYNKGELIILK